MRPRFRALLAQMKDMDTEKKKKILKSLALLKVKILDESVGINTEEDSDAEDEADQSEEDEQEEEENEDQDEGVILNDDNI